jgi:hypothetical protein
MRHIKVRLRLSIDVHRRAQRVIASITTVAQVIRPHADAAGALVILVVLGVIHGGEGGLLRNNEK